MRKGKLIDITSDHFLTASWTAPWLSYAAPSEPRRALLSYNAPCWVTQHHTELRRTQEINYKKYFCFKICLLCIDKSGNF